MPTHINSPVAEGNTAVFHLLCWDQNSLAVAPNSLYWTLHDGAGLVINSRENIGINSLQSSMDLAIDSSDTTMQADKAWSTKERRYITFTGNYNSDIGNNRIITGQLSFDIYRFVKVGSQ